MRIKINETLTDFFSNYDNIYHNDLVELFGDNFSASIISTLNNELSIQGDKYLINYYTRLYYTDVTLYTATLIDNTHNLFFEKWKSCKNTLALLYDSSIDKPYTELTETNINDTKNNTIQNKRNNYDNQLQDTNTSSKTENNINTIGQVVKKSRSDTLHNIWQNAEYKNNSIVHNLIDIMVIDIINYTCIKIY